MSEVIDFNGVKYKLSKKYTKEQRDQLLRDALINDNYGESWFFEGYSGIPECLNDEVE